MKERFLWLEALRGLAAIWVLLHHADSTVTAFIGSLDSKYVSSGWLGVDFFFILSGFIISFSTRDSSRNQRNLSSYLLSRFLRIYLPYLPVGLGMYLAYTIFPEVSASNRDIGLLTSITLIPTFEKTALNVAWTLKYEMLFYLIFSSYFFGRFFHFAVMFVWFLGIVLCAFLAVEFDCPFLKILFHPINIWFFVGILIERIPRVVESRKLVFTLAMVSLVTLMVFIELGLSRWFVGVSLALLIYCFSSQSVNDLRLPSFFVYAGAASYSVYLVHYPVQSVVVRVLNKMGDFDVFESFVLIAVISFFAGLIYYSLVDKPSKVFSRRLLKRLFGERKREISV